MNWEGGKVTSWREDRMNWEGGKVLGWREDRNELGR
jgi:hypothetical protein